MFRPPNRRSIGVTVHRHAVPALIALLTLWSCGEADPTTPDPDPDPTPSNAAPVAQAGADRTVSATLGVGLDGSASSDADGDALTFAWSLASVPAGSGAALDDPTAERPSFTPDVAGTYVARLVVSDGTDDSAPDDVSIEAENNTASAMIDASGGGVTSADDAFALEVPAGALGDEQEVSVTRVAASQRPVDFSDVGPDATAFDLRPDGLQFDVPATFDFTPPAALQPTAEGDEYTVPLWASVTLADGTLELASEQEVVADLDAMTSVVHGAIEHFSTWVSMPLFRLDGEPRSLSAALTGPSQATVGEPFDVMVGVAALQGVTFAAIDVVAADDSESPVEQQAPFATPLPLVEAEGASGRIGSTSYLCTEPGGGTLAVDVEISGLAMPVPGELRIAAEKPLRVRLFKSVNCIQELQAFGPFDLPSPEGFAPLEVAGPPEFPGPMVYAHTGGARLADENGASLADFSAPALAGVPVYGAAGNPDDGVMVVTPQGLFASSGALPTEPAQSPPTRTLEAVPSPQNGPDLSMNATDVIGFGGVGARGFAAVINASREIVFFRSGTDEGVAPGFVIRSELLDAFKPGGVSVFGVDFPVSVYVGPNGFDEDNPMLAVTVTDDAAEESKLWRVALEAGQAVATQVDNVFPAAGARQVRCTENVCAVASYGTAVGFGGVSRFTWNGDEQFTPIAGFGGGRAVGIDVRLLEAEPMGIRAFGIAETSFLNDTYTVTSVSATGDYLDSVTNPVPEGCEGPGHIRFRSGSQVIISCNVTGRITVADFFLPG